MHVYRDREEKKEKDYPNAPWQDTVKSYFRLVWQKRTQVSPYVCIAGSESLPGTLRLAKNPRFLQSYKAGNRNHALI